jgi:hypothetical protein
LMHVIIYANVASASPQWFSGFQIKIFIIEVQATVNWCRVYSFFVSSEPLFDYT